MSSSFRHIVSPNWRSRMGWDVLHPPFGGLLFSTLRLNQISHDSTQRPLLLSHLFLLMAFDTAIWFETPGESGSTYCCVIMLIHALLCSLRPVKLCMPSCSVWSKCLERFYTVRNLCSSAFIPECASITWTKIDGITAKMSIIWRRFSFTFQGFYKLLSAFLSIYLATADCLFCILPPISANFPARLYAMSLAEQFLTNFNAIHGQYKKGLVTETCCDTWLLFC